MNNYIYKPLILISLLLLAVACDDDDFTGDSTLTPSSPTVTVTIPNNDVSLIEKDSTFEYTITLSEPQISDVAVYIKQISGDASLGEDFSIGSDVVIIPANTTKGTAIIKVNADELAEETETFTVQIGDERTANATITPQTINFTVMNVSENDLTVELSWDAKLFDGSGEPVDPTDIADLIFYLTDANGTVIDAADGAAFEALMITEDMPDGEYLLKAGVFSVISTGDLADAPVMDLTIEYSQPGIIDPTTMIFPQSMSAIVCSSNLFTLASVTKVGNTYTLNEVGAYGFDMSNFSGDYDADEPGYKVYPVSFTVTDCNTITNDNFWDAGFAIDYVLDPETGIVTIPEQDFDASAFGLGTLTVTGSGTFDPATFGMVVDYTIVDSSGAVIDDNTHTFVKL